MSRGSWNSFLVFEFVFPLIVFPLIKKILKKEKEKF